MTMTRSAGWIATLVVAMVAVAATARADDAVTAYTDCFGKDSARRIEGCTTLIESGAVGQYQLPDAYSMRALGYSIKGDYATAIKDYDTAIGLRPDFAVALNNRAWAYFKSGQFDRAWPDVEKSLQLEPRAAHSLDTRAHLRQLKGDAKGALNDYTKAMYFGGQEMIKLYQCGLTEAGLYEGKIDGIWRREVQEGLEQCVTKSSCDPLPADEHCRPATS
jgi:tetratricopeptide (TPR) repeat protein